MSYDNRSSSDAVSPMICPNIRGRIGKGEVVWETNSGSESRRRSRSSRERRESRNLRPKGSDPVALATEATKDDESEIAIPETERIPNTPSMEELQKA